MGRGVWRRCGPLSMTVPITTFGQKFEVFVKAVAEHMGMGVYGSGGTIGLPEDPSDLALAIKKVDLGWKRFLRADGRWSWRFLDRTISLSFDATGNSPLNVNGEAWRYRMPWYFTGQYKGDWFYEQNTNFGLVRIVPEDQILRMRTIGPIVGIPRFCAFRHLKDVNGRGSPLEAIFHPEPSDTALAVSLRVRAYAGAWEISDRSIAGPEFDDVIEKACKAEAEVGNENQRGVQLAEYTEALIAAINLDKRSGPRTVGMMVDPETLSQIDPRAYHGFDGVRSIDGVPLDAV